LNWLASIESRLIGVQPNLGFVFGVPPPMEEHRANVGKDGEQVGGPLARK
jgi:hypothetical protein